MDGIKDVGLNSSLCLRLLPFSKLEKIKEDDKTPDLKQQEENKDKVLELKSFAEKVQYVTNIKQLIEWDMATYMPKEAAKSRSRFLSFLTEYENEILTSDNLNKCLEYLRREEVYKNLSKVDQVLVTEITKLALKQKTIPLSILQELEEIKPIGGETSNKAYKENNFYIFAPTLEKIIKLKQKVAGHIGYESSPYDVILNYYEPGMTTKELDKLFAEVKVKILPIIRKINALGIEPDTSFLNKKYEKEKLLLFVTKVLEKLGFDFSKGRIDEGESPFCQGIEPNDVRLTFNIFEEALMSTILDAIHECGHGLYCLGIDPSIGNTPLFDGTSIAFHESQAKLYESIIGQGLSFWKYFFPKLKEIFPEQLKDVSLEDFYKAINKVGHSSNRITSDEIEYLLHVMVKYEVERDLIEGKLEVKDVPKVWNEKMLEHVGVAPATHVEGVLEDVHWFSGDIGYFPTYALGVLYSAQIYNTLKKEIPDIEGQISQGNFSTLNKWLKEKIYKYGKIESADEIIQRVTGEKLNINHFVNYIKDKYSKIYNTEL